jgi:hypothetical protein
MGVDPVDTNYLKPAAGDVWDFIRSMNVWVLNPDRLGLA